MSNQHWYDTGQIQCDLEQVFKSIQRHRMTDVPLLNPKLTVQALSFRKFQEEWVGILITPWFMNLLLMPGLSSTWRDRPAGEKINYRFPNGEFVFTIAREAQLGVYAACSLFSPMFQFSEQAVAVTAAQAALQELFSDTAAAAQPSRTLSRRDLLRGNITGRHSPS